MRRKHNPNLTVAARLLRKNMTPQERRLWYNYLRDYPVNVLRQKVIGGFVVDFYCRAARLAIELDGGQHYTQLGLAHDNERSAFLEAYGLSILRFSNTEVDCHFNQVCTEIDRHIKQAMQHR